ncbi:hypothetical protein BpHYR1_046259 [Brachionus plicatilis]|uniref:Uncharacterized protein n=1 Tax=Brachionus plicatilis TaxID=10195 RepID=A0A3M7S542_BRAPC|nr:hypothetical protein BpHYR1_046259 [Brachionus plicatilis]
MNASRKQKSFYQKQILICMIFLLTCTMAKCMEMNEHKFLNKLLAYEQSVNLAKREDSLVTGLSECLTVEECREIFRQLILKYSVGKKSHSNLKFEKNLKKISWPHETVKKVYK